VTTPDTAPVPARDEPEPELLTHKIKYVYASFGLTAGMALLFALMPSVFFGSFVSSDELQALSQFPQQQLNPILADLTQVRQAIFRADCWRSFWIIVIGTTFLLLYKAKKLKSEYLVGALTLLCLIDMWQVNKRYLHDDMFAGGAFRGHRCGRRCGLCFVPALGSFCPSC